MPFIAHAKINLRLAVLAREAGGYHQIETIFCRVALADELDVIAGDADGITLHVHGAELGAAEDNLVVRAARAYCREAGVVPRFAIRLHKRVPVGAGLGGGSSDAAATLRALDTLHDGALGGPGLLALGARLGSDVPFFLADTPCALAWGRGERILTLPGPGGAPALIAVPDRAVSTAAAYARLSARLDAAPRPAVLGADVMASWENLAAVAHNDFEQIVLPEIPALAPALSLLRAHGAVIARLTGSGSAVFGVFTDSAARDDAAAALGGEVPTMRALSTTAAV